MSIICTQPSMPEVIETSCLSKVMDAPLDENQLMALLSQVPWGQIATHAEADIISKVFSPLQKVAVMHYAQVVSLCAVACSRVVFGLRVVFLSYIHFRAWNVPPAEISFGSLY